MTEMLRGKKTYIVAAIAVVYLFGGAQGWWKTDPEIMGILGALGLATLRSGVAGADKAAKMLAVGLAGALLAVGSTGCAKVQPGNDPVVVNAERTTALALETFDAFLKWEFENREALSIAPDIRRVSDEIRRHGRSWLSSARVMTKAYKANRTTENRANLETALAVLSGALQEARLYLGLKPELIETPIVGPPVIVTP